jgi:hypothetical protein
MKLGIFAKAFSPPTLEEVFKSVRLLSEIAPDNLASLMGFFFREPQATTVEIQKIVCELPRLQPFDLFHAYQIHGG